VGAVAIIAMAAVSAGVCVGCRGQILPIFGVLVLITVAPPADDVS
jgi:hypothetical protein